MDCASIGDIAYGSKTTNNDSILYSEKYGGKEECNSIFGVERIIKKLDELLHSNKYRVII
ncbi:hypothetical protein LAD12857_19890 [Lacrimispora amygdalina]|uniref:Uncharacterized protein n=1 Tax=Lacrimispora amygdalina TaxID=253257 RepID=A0ABQ5M584_9FIRM